MRTPPNNQYVSERLQEAQDAFLKAKAWAQTADKGRTKEYVKLWANYSVPGIVLTALTGSNPAGMFGMGILALGVGLFWEPKHKFLEHVLSLGGLCLLINGLLCTTIPPLVVGLAAVGAAVYMAMQDDEVVGTVKAEDPAFEGFENEKHYDEPAPQAPPEAN